MAGREVLWFGEPVLGVQEAASSLDALTRRADGGDAIYIGDDEVPLAKLVRRDAVALDERTVMQMVRGIGTIQANRMLERSRQPDATQLSMMAPDREFATVIADLSGTIEGRRVAESILVDMMLELIRLYRNDGMEPPSTALLLDGLILSIEDRPKVIHHLKAHVFPQASRLLERYFAFVNPDRNPPSGDTAKPV